MNSLLPDKDSQSDVPRQLFRKDALDNLSSPEQLDQLVEVISPKAWLPVTLLSSLLIGTLAWSILGRLPLYVTGPGVLIHPRQVVSFQAPGSGPIQTLTVQPGDTISQGDVIGTINQAAIEQELQQEQEKLLKLQSQTKETLEVKREEIALKRQNLLQQRSTLLKRLVGAQGLNPIIQKNGIEAIRESRKSLILQLSQIRQLLPTLEERLEGRRNLYDAGAISTDDLFQAQQEYFRYLTQLAELEAKLRQLDVQESETQLKAIDNQSRIDQIQDQLQRLDSQEKELLSQEKELSFSRENRIREIEFRIAQLKEQLHIQGQILSPYDGQVLEVNMFPGQRVARGTTLGTIQAYIPKGELLALGLFPIKDGKKITPGMPVQVTPQTVKAERFGGIIGEVVHVSPFPKTTANVAAQIGNPELANLLGGNQAPVETIMQLTSDENTTSGYAWTSSRGPSQEISSGTSTIVKIKVDDVAPIAYVIPLLRSWSGIY